MTSPKTVDPRDAAFQAVRTMLTSIKKAVQRGNFQEASIWAAQAVEGMHGDDVHQHRAQVYTAVTSVLIASAWALKRAVLRGSGLFAQLTPNAEVLLKTSGQLCELARMQNRELALGIALVIQGFATQLKDALVSHAAGYRYTKADELDAALNALDEILSNAERLTTDDNTRGGSATISDTKLAGTVISNTQSCLSRICSRRFSDWQKAQVLVKHAEKLVGSDADGDAQAKPHAALFERVQAALTAQDYSTSTTALSQLAAALSA